MFARQWDVAFSYHIPKSANRAPIRPITTLSLSRSGLNFDWGTCAYRRVEILTPDLSIEDQELADRLTEKWTVAKLGELQYVGLTVCECSY